MMARTLNMKRRPAASGQTKSVVIFLHGYGADGSDLMGLADPLAPFMRDTVFLAPDAPEQSMGNPGGFQWFPIPWLDGSTEEDAARGIELAAEDVDALIDQVLEQEGISPSELILFGFSQGTMMALHVAPKRAEPVAGIVAISGRILEPETFGEGIISRPPIMLIHGDQDDMVPMGHFHEAGEALEGAEFSVYGHVMEGTGHGIAQDGLSVALTFMAQQLGIELKME